MVNEPEFSIIIPTRSVADNLSLRSVLDSLSVQKGIEDQQIIVVNDGGGKAMIGGDHTDLAIEIIDLEGNMGPGTARNRGLGIARGEKVIFLDDDSVCASDWLERLMASWRQYPDSAGIGGLYIYDDENTLVSKVHSDIINWFTRSEKEGRQEYISPANGSYLRVKLDQIGGFDESFGTSAGEDTDLALRIVAANGILRIDEKVRAFHARDLGIDSFIRKYYRFGKAIEKVYRRNSKRKRRRIVDYARLYKVSMQDKKYGQKIQVICLITVSQMATALGLMSGIWERMRGRLNE